MPQIKALIRRLAALPATETLANPYASEDAEHDRPGGAAIRRKNLELYLRTLRAGTPSLMICGEAAGYQGCRFSGIAFTSEHTLLTHPFFAGKNYQRSAKRERPWREPSGSIVWETAGKVNTLPVLWNILPFHPHAADKALSNRTPSKSEREMGLPYLLALREIFPEARIVTAGRIASEVLSDAGVIHSAARHPAYGGKHEFQAGVIAAHQSTSGVK
jgi:uracil-DNA glycosylase